MPEPVEIDLGHHGDVEARGMLHDYAVNTYRGARPDWLDAALRESMDWLGDYPDASEAVAALADHHGVHSAHVLPTAGAAEAFTLIARVRRWRRPVVVHPQFTEPHAALVQAGCRVTAVHTTAATGFELRPADIPDDADLVVIGNPTNPTGVLHPARVVEQLARPGRVVVLDEAFMDVVPGEPESLVGTELSGVVVARSLTKTWSIPGVRAGYVVGDPALVAGLARVQTPWSVSTTAIAAMVACTTPQAVAEARLRAEQVTRWRRAVETELAVRGIEYIRSSAPFVLTRPGVGVRSALRARGVAVRRGDTFPGLDAAWVRIAVRSPEHMAALFQALDTVRPGGTEP